MRKPNQRRRAQGATMVVLTAPSSSMRAWAASWRCLSVANLPGFVASVFSCSGMFFRVQIQKGIMTLIRWLSGEASE